MGTKPQRRSRPDPFSGEPKTVWLTEPNAADGRMQLLEPFWFDDPKGKRWNAPKDAIVDGASIPRTLWTLVGSPYTGDYRRASVVHDIACVEAGGDAGKRRAADKMFYHACRAGGCSVAEAIVLYIGVRIGAMEAEEPALKATAKSQSRRPRLTRSALEERLERDFREISEMVLADRETDDPDVIEGRFQQACIATSLASLGLSLKLRAAGMAAAAPSRKKTGSKAR